MAHLTFPNIKIRAVAAAPPVYTQVVDTLDPFLAKFVAQMGISHRHISLTEQTALDLGYVALQQALDKAGWDKDELALVIFNNQTPDYCGGAGNAMTPVASLVTPSPSFAIASLIRWCTASSL